MKIKVVNNLTELSQKIESAKEFWGHDYDVTTNSNVKKKKRWSFFTLLFLALSGVLLFISSIYGNNVLLYVFAMLGLVITVVFFRMYENVPNIRLSKQEYINREIERSFNTLPIIGSIFEKGKLSRIKILGVNERGMVCFSIFYNHDDSDKIQELSFSFKRELTSNESNVNVVKIDFLNKVVTTYFMDNLITGVFYEIDKCEV